MRQGDKRERLLQKPLFKSGLGSSLVRERAKSQAFASFPQNLAISITWIPQKPTLSCGFWGFSWATNSLRFGDPGKLPD